MDEWVKIVQTVGIPAACLVALGGGVWKTLRWFGIHVLVPIRDAHVKFLERVTSALDTQTAALERIGESRGDELKKLEQIAARLGEVAVIITETHAMILKTHGERK